jgi:6-phosphofructokinase
MKTLALMSSGGDGPGMNAAIRSLWRSLQFKRPPMSHEEIHKARDTKAKLRMS